jgi:hypothetical protein
MIFIDEKNVLIKGNIFTNMPFDNKLLSSGGITIHAKRDVFLNVMECPNRMRPEDFYLDYEKFTKTYGLIQDVIGFSTI